MVLYLFRNGRRWQYNFGRGILFLGPWPKKTGQLFYLTWKYHKRGPFPGSQNLGFSWFWIKQSLKVTLQHLLLVLCNFLIWGYLEDLRACQYHYGGFFKWAPYYDFLGFRSCFVCVMHPITQNKTGWGSWRVCIFHNHKMHFYRELVFAMFLAGIKYYNQSISLSLLKQVVMIHNQIQTDGEWGPWTAWSTCSAPCGDGTQSRSRMCNSRPPSKGGAACVGSACESQLCSLKKCSKLKYSALSHFYEDA